MMDGKTYLGKPGDVFSTGVGCAMFANVGNQPVTWLRRSRRSRRRRTCFASWWNERRAQELEG